MHWVYVLKCADNIIYVGETKRLYRRLNEHCNKDSGSCTTHDVLSSKFNLLYKVEDDCSIINDYNWDFEDEKITLFIRKTHRLEMCKCNVWDHIGNNSRVWR